MALSEHEQRMLDEIESALYAEDPKFASSVGKTASPQAGGLGGIFSLKVIALISLGLVLLVAGVALSQQSLWFIALSVAGFGLMFGSGLWGLRSNSGPAPKLGSQRLNLGSSATGGKSKGDISQTMEERFRSRFERPDGDRY